MENKKEFESLELEIIKFGNINALNEDSPSFGGGIKDDEYEDWW